jgi:SAM-dependent methyltransferase
MALPRPLRSAAAPLRRGVRRALARSNRLRRGADIVRHELERALDEAFDADLTGADPLAPGRGRGSGGTRAADYDAAYFGAGRDPLDRMGLSGYERYARETSNADVLAYLVWRFFDARTALDVGCATGFVVEALRELGLDAEGCDVSRWAVTHPSPGAAGHLRHASLLHTLPYRPGSFDVVTAFETLEHLPPDRVGTAIGQLARATRGWVVCTIPSLGRNDHGPDGFPNGKVRVDVLDRYLALGPDHDGPVPISDLMRDATGRLIEGHLCIASYRWWTARFADAGLERRGDVEEAIHPVLARFGLTEFLNLYVFARPGTAVPVLPVRGPAERRAAEERLGLRDRRPPDRALAFLRAGLGDAAVAAAVADADA